MNSIFYFLNLKLLSFSKVVYNCIHQMFPKVIFSGTNLNSMLNQENQQYNIYWDLHVTVPNLASNRRSLRVQYVVKFVTVTVYLICH